MKSICKRLLLKIGFNPSAHKIVKHLLKFVSANFLSLFQIKVLGNYEKCFLFKIFLLLRYLNLYISVFPSSSICQSLLDKMIEDKSKSLWHHQFTKQEFKDPLSSLPQFLTTESPLKGWKMLFISPQKLFSFSRYLSFCLDFFVMYENGVIRKIRLISNFMTSQRG